MKSTIDTRDFTLTHGRNPRGTGAWFFTLTDQADGLRDLEVIFTGTYTKAKRYALDRCRVGRFATARLGS